MTYDRPTEPLHVVDVLVEGFRLFRASIRSLYLPALLLVLIVGAINPVEIPSRDSAESLVGGDGFWLRFIAFMVAGFYMYAVITAIVHYTASGVPEGVPSPLSIATRRFPVILAVNLVFVLGVSLGTMLLIVPGIFLFVTLYFSPLLPIIEGKGLTESIRGSIALVQGHWWRTFTVAVITITFGFAASAVGEEAALYLADWLDSDLAADAVSRLTYAAFEAIIYSLSVCITYALFQDLRMRQHVVTP